MADNEIKNKEILKDIKSGLENEHIKKYRSLFKTIHFKVDMAVAITGLILMFFTMWLVDDSMQKIEIELMNDRLDTEISVLIDELQEKSHETSDAAWSIRDGGLYMGDTLIGDGKAENADTEPFEHCQKLTGAFYYSLMRTYNEEELHEVEMYGHRYQQGHYMRVAGSTRGTNYERLEGTYLEKNIADQIDASEDGIYVTIANINGVDIYTHYERILDKDGQTIGVLASGRRVEDLERMVKKQQRNAFFIILVVMMFINVVLGFIVYSIVKSIAVIRQRLNVIGTGEFPEEPLVLKRDDELTDVAETINQMVESLRNNQRIEGELEIASGIQMAMLPNRFPAFPERNEFDIFAGMRPAKEVGGDFYDFFLLNDKTIAVVMADVSGKGVPAAMIMAITRTLIRSYAQTGMSLSQVFDKVNKAMCADNEDNFFVTAWIGALNTETGLLTYVNAGHNPPLIKRMGQGESGQFEYLKMKPNLVLGGIESIVYSEFSLKLEPGDKIFLYTDGVTEAMDKDDNLYGEARLRDVVNAAGEMSAKEIVRAVKASLEDYIGEEDQFDDITMLALNYEKAYEKQDIFEDKAFLALPEYLESVNNFVERELGRLECPDTIAAKIIVAVEEVFLNIANYAYGGGKGSMHLTIRSYGDNMIELVFKDHGTPFDPLAKKDPDVSEALEDRNIGGLGIFMVKRIMDQVEYRYEDGYNIFTMRKKIQ